MLSLIIQAKSRREQIIEYTGKELQQRISKGLIQYKHAQNVKNVIPGNMLVTSRHSSEKSTDAIKKHPQIAADLGHWIEAVYAIARGSTTEYVQAVNLTRQIPPPNGMRNYQVGEKGKLRRRPEFSLAHCGVPWGRHPKRGAFHWRPGAT